VRGRQGLEAELNHRSQNVRMAVPLEVSRHVDRWIGTFPSPWWIYLRLRARGYLAPGASGAAVRRIVADAIREAPRGGEPGASWNTRVPAQLWEAKLLSAKGEEMALWMPSGGRMR
jgi:hypothetical protein